MYGYYVGYGYFGLVKGELICFTSQEEYVEYLND